MKSTTDSVTEQKQAPITSLGVFGARLTWVIIGPIALLFTLVGIVSGGKGWTTVLDGLYILIVGLMVLGRWVEQRSGQGTTAMGEPSTVEQCRRYSYVLVSVAAVAWIGANVVGNHMLQ